MRRARLYLAAHGVDSTVDAMAGALLIVEHQAKIEALIEGLSKSR